MMPKFENMEGHSQNYHILKGINLAVEMNEVVSLIGGNGTGKSTIAKEFPGMLLYKYIYFNCELPDEKSINDIVNQRLIFFRREGRFSSI
jgi:Fe-S cluster assembly ATPase SufC